MILSFVQRLKPAHPQPYYSLVRHASSSPMHCRIKRLINHLPKSLRPYVSGLTATPVSHITSFLILHEITAVVPLVVLGLGFHYLGVSPYNWIHGEWTTDGLQKFSTYFGRKGWFGFERLSERPDTPNHTDGQEELNGHNDCIDIDIKNIEENWVMKESGMKILVEVATAYAITKLLLPVRLFLSIWGTPWFARVIIGRLGGKFTRKLNSRTSSANSKQR